MVEKELSNEPSRSHSEEAAPSNGGAGSRPPSSPPTTEETQAKPQSAEKLVQQVVNDVTDKLDADLVFYAGDMSDAGARQLCGLVRDNKQRPNVALVLATYGGSAHAAYRMARTLQRCYAQQGRMIIILPSYCKSAGTLLALSANELVMTDDAELGPLDVQVGKRDEIGEWTSGLTTVSVLRELQAEAYQTFLRSFLNLRQGSGLQISTKTAADISTQLATGLFAPVYAQVDPVRVSEMSRLMNIARAYGERLASNNVRDGALLHLVENYPDHGFIIDREEASNLFQDVRAPDGAEFLLLAYIDELVKAGVKGDSAYVDFFPYKPFPKEDETHGTDAPASQKELRKDAGGSGGTAASGTEAPSSGGRPHS